MKLEIENQDKVFQVLNDILELEMSGIVRYTHYSLMIIGHGRIPIVSWLKSQAQESLQHATRAGEIITHFEQHPSLEIANLLETHNHNIDHILTESLQHERASLAMYRELLSLTKDKSVILEEYARQLIIEEETHIGEVEKMLKKS